MTWYGKHNPGFEWTADCLVLLAGTHPVVIFVLGTVAYEAPSQPTKITAFRTTVKILSQFMPLPDSVPPIVETFKKRVELESQPSVEVDDVCGVFFYPRFDECEIREVGANNIAI